MKKLIEALHVIQDECRKYAYADCVDCPLVNDSGRLCRVTDAIPDHWEINDEVQKALL